MDESPNSREMFSSQQVPIIGWDMESPNTVKVSPRSIILPRPKSTESNASPANKYIIEQWGNCLRNKRRIRRPPRPNAYQSPVVTSVTTPPASEKDEADDWSDWGDDEDILDQMQIGNTPLAKCTVSRVNQSTSNQSPSNQSPTAPGTSKQKHVFKTPTMFKTTARTANDQVKLPRKLTAEFDNVNPISLLTTPVCSTTANNQQAATPNKQPTTTNTQPYDDDDLLSDNDDEELMRQADIFLATSSQSAKQTSQSQPSELASSGVKPAISHQPPVHEPPVQAQPAPAAQQQTVENKENIVLSDSDMFDDSFMDDELALNLDKQLSQIENAKKDCRTPPRGNTPQKKKQRLSLSLKKKK